ncbi:hypothetical protein [Bradyrhizobium ivorense]|nr:hypothetical protein [Bradyrhizobium ivorense]
MTSKPPRLSPPDDGRKFSNPVGRAGVPKIASARRFRTLQPQNI